MKTAFIGCGNMGGALASAICRALEVQNVYVADATPQKALQFAATHGCQCADNQKIAASCDWIVLAVKPQVLESVLTDLSPILKQRSVPAVLVSIAAGIPLFSLERWSDSDFPIFRVMPNTPALVGDGMILYTANDAVTEEQRTLFTELFHYAGELDYLPEGMMDAAGALSGCGPAFVCLFADALADGAVQCGVPKEKALRYAWQTLLGTAQLAITEGKHPAALKDAVCSPGGTTIEGVHALEKGKFRAASMNAVTAAYEKTLKLKK
jgi:pyrroline-5-carboxylate reductase